MFDVYLSSVPHKLNTMAIAFGEVFFLEAYLRRLTHLSCPSTLKVFQSLGLLYGLWNIADNGRLGDFREGDLLSSDQVQDIKERVLSLTEEL